MNSENRLASREIIDHILNSSSLTRDDITREKMRVAAKYKLGKMPSNSELIRYLTTIEAKKLLPILKRKATRTLSGVTVVAVMTKPYPCPQPEPCAYCPGGPAQGVPQSYTGHEPASMRGVQHSFDPCAQVKSRIEQLTAIGHEVDKVELIVMGGTFPAVPIDYQEWFIRQCLDAITDESSRSLAEAKTNAEKSRVRNVGITIETRPDWAKQEHVDHMLLMGTTRIEIGVQNPKDAIYRRVGRTHTVRDVVEATRVAKDSGLKLAYHLMPGMPGSNPKEDVRTFTRIFRDERFRPDMIKIYPCLVVKDTKACDWYERGEFSPYSTKEAVEVIAEVKKSLPPWVRVMRVQRDIPAQLIMAGVKKSNLRQLVQQKLHGEGDRCRCIRCREVGHRIQADEVKLDLQKVQILNTRYEASEGTELFISAEDVENDVLIAYLRLRIPSENAQRPEIQEESSSVIRELHVYGPLVPVGVHTPRAWQHHGFGGALLKEAERISSEELGLEKVLVTSALGTKQYYKRFGYGYDGVYMSKNLRQQAI